MNSIYDRSHPFMARILERVSLCLPESGKQTQHLVLDLKGSGITYSVGDCIAVIPSNDGYQVQRLLEAMGSTGDELVVERSGEKWPFREFLVKKRNLNDCTPKFLEEVLNRETDPLKKQWIQELLENKEKMGAVQPENVLRLCQSAHFSPPEILLFLKPLMPRFYSIASSMSAVGEEVHLIVALEKWEASGELRMGVCTDFLCHRAPLDEPVVPIYLHPHKGFTLPADADASLIMVGPGTGIAPFRGFMQERELRGSRGMNWLFFGEWNKKHHFFYEEYWKGLEKKGSLKMNAAFSRDQEHKVYVQDKMIENGRELFEWLQKGAYFFVCGDASKMAKDVDAALHRIISHHGHLSEEESREYVKRLRGEKRYLRDVY